jgi:recombination protein RecA
MATNADVIRQLRARLEKKYKDSTELFQSLNVSLETPVIKTKSAIINAVTGIGGLPRGRVTEIFGPFSSGKTTIATEVIASCHEAAEGTALLIDYEHAFDAVYGKKLGIDLNPDRFIWSQPSYFEQGADIALDFVDAGAVDLIVIDSAAAMTPRSDMEGVMDVEGGTQKGTQAALMARFLERLTKKISKGRKPAVVIINQMRAVINIGGRPKPGAPKEQSAASNAIKFYSSMRLELDFMGSEGDANRGSKGTDQVYTQNRIRITAVKNKLAPPFMRGQFVIEYGKGINNLASIAELAEARMGIMSGSGYFNYKGRTSETSVVCRGRDAFLQHLKDHPATAEEIEDAVLTIIKDEHAKSLGLDKIEVSGKAKELEENPGLTLDGPRTTAPLAPFGNGSELPISDEP